MATLLVYSLSGKGSEQGALAADQRSLETFLSHGLLEPTGSGFGAEDTKEAGIAVFCVCCWSPYTSILVKPSSIFSGGILRDKRCDLDPADDCCD